MKKWTVFLLPGSYIIVQAVLYLLGNPLLASALNAGLAVFYLVALTGRAERMLPWTIMYLFFSGALIYYMLPGAQVAYTFGDTQPLIFAMVQAVWLVATGVQHLIYTFVAQNKARRQG